MLISFTHFFFNLGALLLIERSTLYILDTCVLKWRRQWHPTPILLPGKSHGRRSLVGCSPWGRYESDTTEWLPFHFSLSCTGEGDGNPVQCSCLENPRDKGAWWAAVYGVTQSWTRLKWLSSSSGLEWLKNCSSAKPASSCFLKLFVRGKFFEQSPCSHPWKNKTVSF